MASRVLSDPSTSSICDLSFPFISLALLQISSEFCLHHCKSVSGPLLSILFYISSEVIPNVPQWSHPSPPRPESCQSWLEFGCVSHHKINQPVLPWCSLFLSNLVCGQLDCLQSLVFNFPSPFPLCSCSCYIVINKFWNLLLFCVNSPTSKYLLSTLLASLKMLMNPQGQSNPFSCRPMLSLGGFTICLWL